MVTVNEQSIKADDQEGQGLLTDRVEQDLSDTLNEFGSHAVGQEYEERIEAPRVKFGYGIPMAGVRCYVYANAD